jgi:hypothetical protein
MATAKTPEEIPWDVTHVLNMCTIPSAPDPSRTYLQIPLLDWDDMSPHIDSIVSFISSALTTSSVTTYPPTSQLSTTKKRFTVLVYCALGINRSAAAVIAYLCWKNEGWRTEQAVGFLKERKGDVRPSAVFLDQIDRHFERKTGKEDVLVGFLRRLEERKRDGGGGEKMCD